MNQQRQKRRRHRRRRRHNRPPDRIIPGIGIWDAETMTAVIPSEWVLRRHSTSVLTIHVGMGVLEVPTDWKVDRYIP